MSSLQRVSKTSKDSVLTLYVAILSPYPITHMSSIQYSNKEQGSHVIVSTIFLYYAKLINVKLMVLFTIINIFPVVIVLRDLYNSMNKRNFIITSNFLKLEMLLVLVIFYFGR